MRAQVLLIALALAGCAADNAGKTALWRDATGQHRQDAALHQDEAACDYEISMAAAMAPGRTPARYQAGEFTATANNLSTIFANAGPNRDALGIKCMAARGWQFVGWE